MSLKLRQLYARAKLPGKFIDIDIVNIHIAFIPKTFLDG